MPAFPSVLFINHCSIAAVGGENLVGFSSPIILGGVSCNGSEELLVDCAHSGIGVHNCSVREAVAFCAGQKYVQVNFMYVEC